MSVLSAIYGQAVSLRRSWYARHPSARRNLARPVISVGNLTVGGSGKTPLVAALARMLLDIGHRPAILSRGYGRRDLRDGVVVVSDGEQVRATVEQSGDEPQMLARMLPGVPVLVSGDRYLAGTLAQNRFGATVLLLDDGFQHLQLARTIDLLVVAPSDLDDELLPAGRLREPLDAARAADALLVHGSDGDRERAVEALGGHAAFGVRAVFRPLELLAGVPAAGGMPAPESGAGPTRLPDANGDAVRASAPNVAVFAVAGIARPERFVDALRSQGHHVAGQMTFRDHHWFTQADVERAVRKAREAGAALVVTTRKDAVRLERLIASSQIGWAILPMEVEIHPADAFRRWIEDRLGSGSPAERP